MPGSCSFKIAMICSSLNLLRFIPSNSFASDSTQDRSHSGEHVMRREHPYASSEASQIGSIITHSNLLRTRNRKAIVEQGKHIVHGRVNQDAAEARPKRQFGEAALEGPVSREEFRQALRVLRAQIQYLDLGEPRRLMEWTPTAAPSPRPFEDQPKAADLRSMLIEILVGTVDADRARWEKSVGSISVGRTETGFDCNWTLKVKGSRVEREAVARAAEIMRSEYPYVRK